MKANPAVIRSYAEALFAVARDRGRLDEIATEASALRVLVAKDARLKSFLYAPNFTRAEKEKFFGGPFGDTLDPLFRNFVFLLVRRGRFEWFDQVEAAFLELVRKHRGIASATVTTAVAVASADRARLQAALDRFTGKKLEIAYEVEPKVIGGVRFECGDILVDQTIAQGLARLETRLSQVAVI